jgi:hypothetical protein
MDWLTNANQGIAAMTSQTAAQLRARYARMYAIGIFTLLAATVTTAAWTTGTLPSPAMDVSAMMVGIDLGNLPVQAHVDAI